MVTPASDEQLWARQLALQAEARDLLAELDLPALLGDAGSPSFTGSFVSGLMCWRELDVMVHVGAGFSPRDVLSLLQRFVERPGVIGVRYDDERGPRSPTGTARDERYHAPVVVERAEHAWQLDLTLWLNDPHHNLTAWHEELRESITVDQRDAVLRIKDVWHRRPDYPGGLDVYTAVLEHGVRTAEQFAAWHAGRGR